MNSDMSGMKSSSDSVEKTVLVIGVGAAGLLSLTPDILARIAQADQLWGGKRQLAGWESHPAEKIVIGADIALRVHELEHRGDKRVVILASGDPGFYGIVSTLLRVLPAHDIEVIPHVSSLQLAFARVGVDWNEATLTSAHSRPLSEVVGWAKRARKMGILTDHQNTPALIARTLLDAGLDDCRAVVGENLGLADERITDTRLVRLPEMAFGPLNVLLLIRDADWAPWPTFAPRPEEAYAHQRGLITKRDIRALSLAYLALRETDTVWDIGAGSGAVSIEMAELAWRGQVYAVEQDGENLADIRENAARFGALNVTVVSGHAPDALAELPSPSAVFVGGTGGGMGPILRHIHNVARPGCRIVANLATLENLAQMLQLTKELGWKTQVAQINISHGKDIAGLTRLVPLNPVFVLSAQVCRDE